MKLSKHFAVVGILCLLSSLSVHARILKSGNMNGEHFVSVQNSERGYYSLYVTSSEEIGVLDVRLDATARGKNLNEAKGVCLNPKMEMNSHQSCHSEEIVKGKPAAQRACVVTTLFTCQ